MRRPSKPQQRSRRAARQGGADDRVKIVIKDSERRRDKILQTLGSVQEYLHSLRPKQQPLPDPMVPSFLEAIRQHRDTSTFQSEENAPAVLAAPSQVARAPRSSTLTAEIDQSKLRCAFIRPFETDEDSAKAEISAQSDAQARRMVWATHAMNTTLLLTAAPIGAALITYSVLRAPHMATSCRAMALVGAGLVIMQQFPVFASLVGMA